jgi:hypothetical protein
MEEKGNASADISEQPGWDYRVRDLGDEIRFGIALKRPVQGFR